jgi:hypothetical protein
MTLPMVSRRPGIEFYNLSRTAGIRWLRGLTFFFIINNFKGSGSKLRS